MKIQPSDLNEDIRKIPLPENMRELPVSKKGYPVPFFVARSTAPDWDFRVVHPETAVRCYRDHLCWICGQKMGTKKAFVVGPMCVVTKTSAEPASHYSCAQYSAIACPFLARPNMRRNEKDLPEGHQPPAGVAIMRNPGVTAVLVTRTIKPFKDHDGGLLFQMGEPDAVEWYALRGRANRKQVMDSIESGLPLLQEQCNAELNQRSKELAHEALARQVSQTMRWLPDDASAPGSAEIAAAVAAKKRNPWQPGDAT